MGNNIWEYDNLDFSNIKLRMPKPLQGGTYFSKIENDGKPLLIQTPKCLTKNGIHKTGKKSYVDLKFSLDDKHIIEWITSFEEKVKSLIYEKKDIWFHDEPTEDEIDYLWSSSIRNAKDIYLLRAYIQRTSKSEQIQVWDEDESEISLDDIEQSDKLISIIELGGLKFTSQSFCLDLYLRQVVVIKDKPIFNKCLIKIKKDNDNKLNLQLSKKNDLEQDNTNHENDDGNDNELEKEQDESNNIMEKDDNTGNDIDDTNEEDSSMETGEGNKEESTEEDIEEEVVEKSDIDDKKETIEEDIEEKNILEDNLNEKIKQDVEKDISDKKDNTLVKNTKGVLEEFELKVPETVETMTLKTPRDVYLEIYKKARRKALDAKKEAIKAFLEAKNIRETYLLDQYDDDSEEEEFMEFLETGGSS
jgi:hypothetical protein